jgi:hypothetical protein
VWVALASLFRSLRDGAVDLVTAIDWLEVLGFLLELCWSCLNDQPEVAAMDILDILMLPLELLDFLDFFGSTVDSFSEWRQAAADTRARRFLEDDSRGT